MSRVVVYKILPDGDAIEHGEARNAMAGALWIWNTLAKERGLSLDLLRFEPLWELFCTDRLSRDQSIVLGFTFDGVWIRRENLPRVVAPLRAFWRANVSTRVGASQISPTIPVICDLLESAAALDIRGVCFNQTSVNANPWWIAPEDDEEGRPFNFDRDTQNSHGTAPWELFSKIDPAYGQAP